MSPKPVDLERALETLRAECPTSEATEQAREALFRTIPPPIDVTPPLTLPTRRGLARPLTAMLIVTSLAFVVLMPRTTAGSAWAQTLTQSFDSVPIHSVSRMANGKVGYEQWRSGRKRAHVLYDRNGKALMEQSDNGQWLYNSASSMFIDPKRPNARLWGTVSRSIGPNFLGSEIQYGSPEALLKQRGVEVVNHEPAENGKPEAYRLRIPMPYREAKEERLAEIGNDGRIRRLTYPNGRGGVDIEYPESIPDAVFEPRPHAIPVPDVFTGKDYETIQRDLRQGLGKRGPVTLRSVIVTGDGDLWVFWTGALPDGKASLPFSINSVKCGPAFTNKIFTTAWRESPKMNGVPVETKGPRLGGMGRTPFTKLGPTIDLEIPYPGGTARFRKVRYRRVGLIQNVSDILGAKRDYR